LKIRKAIILLLLLPSLCNAQPAGLDKIHGGIGTMRGAYATTWVCLGDTLDVDTTDKDGVITRIDGYWITSEEVTTDLIEWYMYTSFDRSREKQKPATGLSADMVRLFLQKMNATIGSQWAIPTLDQWLFAFEGGIYSEHYAYSGSNRSDLVGWMADNSGDTLHYGAKLITNEIGISDMTGNVAEMVTLGDSIVFVGGSYLDQPVKLSRKQKDKQETTQRHIYIKSIEQTPPETRGLRIVYLQPLWFNTFHQRVWR